VARRLSALLGLPVYGTDEAMAEHGRRCPEEAVPLLSEFRRMSMDERWLQRSPQVMLESFHWFQGEGFDCIVDDVRSFPAQPGVIVEGFRLLPERVKPLLEEGGRAVWLLPSPQFRRAAFASRGALWDIAGKTSEPERALSNLLERDRLFTDRLRSETVRLGLPAIEVEVGMTEAELVDRVAAIFR